uniref:ATP synthase complex subunit 8 n=1 Tax=Oxytauchira brachyptera TaxID=2708015 RepID=A0A6G6BK73_9ORTH|nr:ATP synthase F0 subunit 8 [Oxytauchira brachyptera]QID48448.1 ATP synthase F0 subunit 8 [Oxytauchira brachyptera]QON98950.1 ATP synthase F0 subunit 8 [Oxytauchira brachyptera]
MPQMSPILWFLLFIMFSITMMLFNNMNFFSYKPLITKKTESKLMFTKNKYWSW